jgi:hypothetical protein
MMKAAAKFDASKIKGENLEKSGGVLDEVD